MRPDFSSEWRNRDVEGLASGKILPVGGGNQDVERHAHGRIVPLTGCFSRWGGFERVDCSSGWRNRYVGEPVGGRIVPASGKLGRGGESAWWRGMLLR